MNLCVNDRVGRVFNLRRSGNQGNLGVVLTKESKSTNFGCAVSDAVKSLISKYLFSDSGVVPELAKGCALTMLISDICSIVPPVPGKSSLQLQAYTALIKEMF